MNEIRESEKKTVELVHAKQCLQTMLEDLEAIERSRGKMVARFQDKQYEIRLLEAQIKQLRSEEHLKEMIELKMRLHNDESESQK